MFSPASRHQLFLLYPREIVIIDTNMKQTVGVIHAERNSSPFHQIMPCQQRDVLYCLHENGCVSFRMQQSVTLPSSVPTSPMNFHHHEVSYDLHGHSETLRISKTCQVYAGAVCPSSEMQVAVLTSEGRVLFWEVEFQQVGIHGRDFLEDDALPTMLSARPMKGAGLVNVGEQEGEDEGVAEVRGLSLADTIAPHWFTPPNCESHDIRVVSHDMLGYKCSRSVWAIFYQINPGELVGGASLYAHCCPNVSTSYHKELAVLCPPGCHGNLQWLLAGLQSQH